MAGKKQHYVPQFLLRNFCVTDSPHHISAYSITDGKRLPRVAIKDAAHENNFYGRPETEDQLAKLEGAASQLIREALQQEVLPARRSSGHDLLLTFVLTQVFRTRGEADATNEMTDLFVKRVLRDHPEVGPHLDQIKVTVKDTPLYVLGTALPMIDLARDLAFKLLCNRTKELFVISDDPAVMYNQFLEPRKRHGCNTGLAVKGLQIFLPLGPRHTLVFFDAEVYKVGGKRLTSQRVEIDSVEDVRELNLLQAANAVRFVYLNDQVTPAEAARLIQRAATARPRALARLEERREIRSWLEPDSSLLRMYSPDLRTRLNLRCIQPTPHAEKYEMGTRLIHYRDPLRVQLHGQFIKEVEKGAYQIQEFEKFLDAIVDGTQPFC